MLESHGEAVIWIGAGLLLIFILAQFFKSPGKLVWKLSKSVVVGCFFIFAVNWVGEYLHFHLPFNPATAFIAGILGLPGLAALITLKLWIFTS